MRFLFLAIAALVVSSPSQASDICRPKRYCTEIKTCAEAHYRYTVCSDYALDRDGDGVPCETMCGKTVREMEARRAAEPFEAAANEETIASADGAPSTSTQSPSSQSAENYSCDGKRTCKQMLTCAEATFYLRQCGVGSLDGDRDGMPCDGLCK